MTKLTSEQEAQLAELERLRDAPEGGGGGGDLSIIIDLGDDKAVKRALALGVLNRGDLDEFDPPGGEGGEAGEGGEGGEGTGGKGGKAGKAGEGGAGGEGAPRRRLSIADRALGGGE